MNNEYPWLFSAIVASNRLYITKATYPNERTTHIGLLSFFQSSGAIIGLAAQTALSFIGESERNISYGSKFYFDMYAAAG